MKMENVFLKFIIILIVVIVSEYLWGLIKKKSKSGFEKWVTNAPDKDAIILEMLKRQSESFKERTKAESRKAEIGLLSETQFIKCLPEFKSFDEISVAIERFITMGEVKYWDFFKTLFDSNEISGQKYYYIRKALNERQKTTKPSGEFFIKLYDLTLAELTDLNRFKWPYGDERAEVMILLNLEQSLKEFNNPKWYDFEKKAFTQILEALNLQGQLLDKSNAELLLQMIPHYLPERSQQVAISEILVLCQRVGVLEYEVKAYHLLSNPNIDSSCANRIADALCAPHGFSDTLAILKGIHKKDPNAGSESWNDESLYHYWIAITKLDGQVNNGGFAQYFGNNYGYQFLTAIKVAKVVGDNSTFEILLTIKNEFDKYERVGDYSNDKLARIYDKVNNVLGDCDSKYYGNANLLVARLKLYLVSQIKSIDLLSKIQISKVLEQPPQ